MKKNIGKVDKFIRLLLVVFFAILAFFYSPYWWILAVILIITNFIGFCGLYHLFGINTIKKEQKDVIQPKSEKEQTTEDKKDNNHINDEIELNEGSGEEQEKDYDSKEIEI